MKWFVYKMMNYFEDKIPVAHYFGWFFFFFLLWFLHDLWPLFRWQNVGDADAAEIFPENLGPSQRRLHLLRQGLRWDRACKRQRWELHVWTFLFSVNVTNPIIGNLNFVLENSLFSVGFARHILSKWANMKRKKSRAESS